MSKMLDIPGGDYRIAVQPGGDIVLHTGVDVGRVIISGDLIVQGEQTTINTTELDVEDRIVRLNINETGLGITPGSGIAAESGIEIVRGNLPNARLVFDESAPYDDPVNATQGLGAFKFKLVDSNGTENTAGIVTNSIDSGGGPLVFDAGSNPLRAMAADYENYVVGDDDIPNRKWVIDYITGFTGANPPSSIAQGDTLVSAEDFDNTGVDSIVRIQVDGFNRAVYGTSSASIYDLTIQGTTISSTNSGDDLNLIAAGGGVVKVADVLQIDSDVSGSSPPAPTAGVQLYHDTTSIKDTGVKYQTATRTGELASYRTAVLFGLIF